MHTAQDFSKFRLITLGDLQSLALPPPLETSMVPLAIFSSSPGPPPMTWQTLHTVQQ
jgi:hypothetical protein